MTKEMFRYFIRKNYKDAQMNFSNEDLDELCDKFTAYLKPKLTDEMRDKIMPRSPMDVIMQSEHPLRPNGFHPALLIHFADFINSILTDSHP